MTRLLSLFCISFLFITGCDGLNDNEIPIEPGSLSLTPINSISDSNNVFDLGDLKSTKSFNFYLTNKGDTDVFNVSIESTNPEFVVEPGEINVLMAGSDLVLEQGLQVTAIHGIGAGGIGPETPMEMGLNETEVRIRAQTTDAAGDTSSIQVSAVMQVNALLADFELTDRNGQVDLSTTMGSHSGGGVAPFPLPRTIVADGGLKLVNTGNVAVRIKTFLRDNGTLELIENEEVVLSPGEELAVERDRETTTIRIDTDQTVTDSDRLPFQLDGFVYILCDITR